MQNRGSLTLTLSISNAFVKSKIEICLFCQICFQQIKGFCQIKNWDLSYPSMIIMQNDFQHIKCFYQIKYPIYFTKLPSSKSNASNKSIVKIWINIQTLQFFNIKPMYGNPIWEKAWQRNKHTKLGKLQQSGHVLGQA